MTWYFEASGVDEYSGLPAILEGHFTTEGSLSDLEGTGTTTFDGYYITKLWLDGVDILPPLFRWAGVGITWDRDAQKVVHPTDPLQKTIRAETYHSRYVLVVDGASFGSTFATFLDYGQPFPRVVRMSGPNVIVRPIPDTPLAAVPVFVLFALCFVARGIRFKTRGHDPKG